MRFLIYRQSKSAMQSGKKNAKKWLLIQVEETNTRSRDEIMGWVSNKSTLSQLKFEFMDKESAVDFAKKNGYDFELIEANNATLKPKSYAANFTN